MVDIKEKISQGYVQSRVIIEIAGRPKEHVEKSIQSYIDQISKNENIIILTKDINKAEEVKDSQGFFVSFVELEILTKNINALIEFCFDYMPSSVEVLEPQELKLVGRDISGLLNDLQAKLHKVDLALKHMNTENSFLKNNTKALLRNMMTILLFSSEKTLEQLSKVTGIELKELEKFLEILIKENHIQKKEGKYSLVKQ